MRRVGVLAACVAALLQVGQLSAHAAPAGYYAAKQAFDGGLSVDQRILVQILLIADGFANGVPTEHLNPKLFAGVQQFQVSHGFAPNGLLDRAQLDRLTAEGGAKLAMWGFRKVTHPHQPVTIWAPVGLGLTAKVNGTGLHMKDPQGRLEFDFVSVPDRYIADVHRATLAEKRAQGADIHYEVMKDGWFVISSTSLDGHDHYYRYHQDGSAVTGFALEWNNAAGNINAERIAVIMSGSLLSAMTGTPFIEPPQLQAEAKAEPPAPPVAQPITVPVVPPPTPEPKKGFSSGTGFFVTDVGHLVTNAHVVKGCNEIAVKLMDGTIDPAVELATDEANDLALLKVKATPARVAAVRVGTRLGEGVEAFGFPHSEVLSSSGNFTLGNVTALTGLHDDVRYLQISAPVQAGNSGGPLLDGSGNLVGVVSAKLDAVRMMLTSDDLPQNVNFAVKSAMVAAFLDANRVTYTTGAPAEKPLEPADIADQARAMSAFVVCR